LLCVFRLFTPVMPTVTTESWFVFIAASVTHSTLDLRQRLHGAHHASLTGAPTTMVQRPTAS